MREREKNKKEAPLRLAASTEIKADNTRRRRWFLCGHKNWQAQRIIQLFLQLKYHATLSGKIMFISSSLFSLLCVCEKESGYRITEIKGSSKRRTPVLPDLTLILVFFFQLQLQFAGPCFFLLFSGFTFRLRYFFVWRDLLTSPEIV